MAFLEVLTRCYKRPTLLVVNQESLLQQTDEDWTQTLLVDDEGLGIGASYERMAAYAPKLVGDYIWILDDDDFCTRRTLVAELKRIVERTGAEMIIIRMDHGPRGVLPPLTRWEADNLHQGEIGVSGFVVKRELWQLCADAMIGHYAADFFFYEALRKQEPVTVWHDVVASQVQQIGLGRLERV